MGNYGVRKLPTLKIRSIKHLCKLLDTDPKELNKICQNIQVNPEKYYRFETRDINGKLRPLAIPKGRFLEITKKLNSLLQRLKFPDNMHGGLKGHSTRKYAEPHLKKNTVLKSDIQDFFPSVRPQRVYKAFINNLDCSPDIARILTMLTTIKGQLPQGSPTSAVVANIVTTKLGKRIQGMAIAIKADSGTFMDDIAISGGSHVRKSKGLLKKIITQEGFVPHPRKTQAINGRREKVIAGIRVNSGFDIPREKIREVRKAIDEIKADTDSGNSIDPQKLNSIRGKIRYMATLNRGTANTYHRRLNKALRSGQ